MGNHLSQLNIFTATNGVTVERLSASEYAAWSQDKKKPFEDYTVRQCEYGWCECSCPRFFYHRACKHCAAVLEAESIEVFADEREAARFEMAWDRFDRDMGAEHEEIAAALGRFGLEPWEPWEPESQLVSDEDEEEKGEEETELEHVYAKAERLGLPQTKREYNKRARLLEAVS